MRSTYFIFPFLVFCLGYISAYGQLVQPTTPNFPSFNNVNVNPKVGTSQSIMQQSNTRRNEFVVGQTKQQRQKQELEELLNDEKKPKQYYKPNTNYYNTAEFLLKTKSYKDAALLLKNMLNGKVILSIRRAYYEMESAYGNPYLTYEEFKSTIKKSTDYIKKWMQEKGYNPHDNEALNLAIQKFMSDTLSITVKKPDSKEVTTVKHLPFKYDYNDFEGKQDYRNFFATKCMATGYGQCNSLPVNYLCFAEQLGAKAYLTFAPQHSFVKYPDNKGNLHNYEPTSHWNISDKWYEDNMGVSKIAQQKGIYLDTLNKRQIVANCLIDLAFGYMSKYGAADGSFVMDCINAASKEFPKNNNIYINFTFSCLMARQLDAIASANKLKDMNDVYKIPQALPIYEALRKNEEQIKAMGYQPMAENMYLEMMGMHEDKKKGQQQNNISGKQKRSLFITTTQ